MRNFYPLSFSDFIEAKKVGNYPTFYCILDDRVHAQRTAESITFVTSRMIKDIKEAYNEMDQDPVSMFIKTNFRDGLSFKYYPTEEDIEYIKSIELFQIEGLETKSVKEYDSKELHIVETEEGFKIRASEEDLLIIKKDGGN